MTKNIEYDIERFLEVWSGDKQIAFLRDVIPLFELFDIEDESDWVEEAVGKENERNVRLIRTVFIMSKLADLHSGTLATLRCRFPGLWKKMEHVQ